MGQVSLYGQFQNYFYSIKICENHYFFLKLMGSWIKWFQMVVYDFIFVELIFYD